MKKINLDYYIDDLPLGVASYRNKIKIVLKDFAEDLLELAAENAIGIDCTDYVDKDSITNTINQIE